jgi:hypothetical protein
MKRIATCLAIPLAAVGVAGCFGSSNADKVSENLSKEAEKFNVQRKILVVNNITDKVLFEVEGRCSIETPGRLEITCKHGPDDYRKHFLGMADNVSYVVAQPNGIDVSEYRTKIIFRPEAIVPDLDLVTGDDVKP